MKAFETKVYSKMETIRHLKESVSDLNDTVETLGRMMFNKQIHDGAKQSQEA